MEDRSCPRGTRRGARSRAVTLYSSRATDSASSRESAERPYAEPLATEALWKLRLTERELEAQPRRIVAMPSAKRPRFLPGDRRELLVRRTVAQFGKPGLLIVDHGCLFRTRLRTYTENTLGITPVSGKIRTYTFSGKAERFFQTIREWTRLVLSASLGSKNPSCLG